MASYSITTADGEVAVHAKSLAADTADTVTFDRRVQAVEVLVTSGGQPVYFTTDGTEPSVAGKHCWAATAGSALTIGEASSDAVRTIKLISAAVAVYHVARADF